MKVPNGIDEIKSTFGDITKYIRPDGMLNVNWQVDQLDTIVLPFPMILSWAPTISVTKMTCHKLMNDVFMQVFNNIKNGNLVSSVQSFGGCFSYRPQRGSHIISTHAWGISIDLNPDTNKQGTDGDMDSALIQIFKDAGFYWGGEFEGDRKDPMHFQYATGY